MNILSNIFYSEEKVPDYTVSYEDRDVDQTLLSSTKVHSFIPIPSFSLQYKHHKNLYDLCKYIAREREPCKKKLLDREITRVSFSAPNRGDLCTEVHLSPKLKKILQIENFTKEEEKEFFTVKTLYEHNSECNGHSYINPEGKKIFIHAALSSSADRKALPVQNLSVVQLLGKNLLYTGRPDTQAKANEQARFILRNQAGIPSLEEATFQDTPSLTKPSWADEKKGIVWNPRTKCIELSYVVYSLLSDSNTISGGSRALSAPYNDEKSFLKKEQSALESRMILVKDHEGKIFKVVTKPIFLSQSFNSLVTVKGCSLEGTLSPVIMYRGWKDLLALLAKHPDIMKKMQVHIETLESYFLGKLYLSPLHLFLHLTIVLNACNEKQELLPLVLHCKSSTDRTGIAAAIVATIAQMKKLNISIPNDMSLLTQDIRFKELFALNWFPMWHERSFYSRDVHGISFGSGIGQSPIVAECLPQRYLSDTSSSLSSYTKSIALVACNIIGCSLQALARHITLLYHTIFLKSRESYENALIVARRSRSELLQYSFYPHLQVNEKGLRFKCPKTPPLTPLQKERITKNA